MTVRFKTNCCLIGRIGPSAADVEKRRKPSPKQSDTPYRHDSAHFRRPESQFLVLFHRIKIVSIRYKMAGVYIRRHGSVVVVDSAPPSSPVRHSRYNLQTPAALQWRSESYQVNGPCNNSGHPSGHSPRPAEPVPVVELTKLRHSCPAHDDGPLQSPRSFQQGMCDVYIACIIIIIIINYNNNNNNIIVIIITYRLYVV